MLDKRNISNKFNNPENKRDPKDLEKRNLEVYEDDSFNEILGYGKLLYHPEKLVGIKNNTSPFPITATISVGNFCNHGCLWCSTAYWREEDAKKIDYKKLMDWMKLAKERGLKAVGYVGNGEPLAFKQFVQISNEINELGLDQGIFTNGYLIDRYIDQLLNFIYVRISLDAGSNEIHSKLHAVPLHHFDKIKKNVELLVNRRKENSPSIGFQFATHQDNIDDLENAVILAKELGIEYLSIKPVFDRGTVRDKIAKNSLKQEDLDKAYNNLKKYNDENFKIFYRPYQIISEAAEQNMLVYSRCYAGYVGVNIYEDGSIVSCGPHKVIVGYLDTPMDELEKNIIKTTDKFDLVNCPAGCRYHPMNYLIHQIKNPEKINKKKHINML